jgi:selT/selW/selH-like putative selenoprotein
LIPGERGAFEISVNGKQVYSKWQTGKFPEMGDLNESIRKFLE